MKSPAQFTSEAELAAAVVAHLRTAGFTVYQEVEGFGGVADIVATRDDRVTVVECKLSLNVDVMDQAWGWIGASHETWIAAPVKADPQQDAAGIDILVRTIDVGAILVQVKCNTRAASAFRQRQRARGRQWIAVVAVKPEADDGEALRRVVAAMSVIRLARLGETE